jgi:hypothetical protein
MTNKISLLRSAAVAAGAITIVALLPQIAAAQASRQDAPALRPGEYQQPYDAGRSPRPDFPGAKQSEDSTAPRPDFPGPKQSDTQPQK